MKIPEVQWPLIEASSYTQPGPFASGLRRCVSGSLETSFVQGYSMDQTRMRVVSHDQEHRGDRLVGGVAPGQPPSLVEFLRASKFGSIYPICFEPLDSTISVVPNVLLKSASKIEGED